MAKLDAEKKEKSADSAFEKVTAAQTAETKSSDVTSRLKYWRAKAVVARDEEEEEELWSALEGSVKFWDQELRKSEASLAEKKKETKSVKKTYAEERVKAKAAVLEWKKAEYTMCKFTLRETLSAQTEAEKVYDEASAKFKQSSNAENRTFMFSAATKKSDADNDVDEAKEILAAVKKGVADATREF